MIPNKVIIMLFVTSIVFTSCEEKINNTKTETQKIYGNCLMCKRTINKAGNLNGIAKVNWDKETKVASITYDSSQTTLNEVLQRIANAGYDNDVFTAPDEAYNDLYKCCKYERQKK
ncbi:cation-transporting ATPase [Cytophagaceae bacterium ABcell3]|nr:cation-transporting ATPase [Cytophagaceae bacterium ABcell3]